MNSVVATLAQYPADGCYTVLRPMTVGGAKLDRGDTLPEDSPIRQQQRRLKVLCEQRMLAPVTEVKREVTKSRSSAPAASTAAAKAPKQTTINYDELTLGQLRKLCRERGIPASGSKAALRNRLLRSDKQ